MKSLLFAFLGCLILASCDLGSSNSSDSSDQENTENSPSDPSEENTPLPEDVPPAPEDIVYETPVELLREIEYFSTLTELIDKHDLQDFLNQNQETTFFAPTNKAFESASETMVNFLRDDAALVEMMIENFTLEERYSTDQLRELKEVETKMGIILDIEKISEDSEKLKIGGAPISAPNLRFLDGIIHGTDRLPGM